MEKSNYPEKRILKPSVIHDDLPEVKKPEHLRKVPLEHDNGLPENPERNYHHEVPSNASYNHDELRQADDDIWNGEDA